MALEYFTDVSTVNSFITKEYKTNGLILAKQIAVHLINKAVHLNCLATMWSRHCIDYCSEICTVYTPILDFRL